MLSEEFILKKNPKYNSLDEIKTLNLWGCDLNNISILSKCKNLEILSLSLNNISNISPLKKCFKLRELYLRKNNISSLSQIDNLMNLIHLRILWLDENPISNLEDYKEYILNTLPQLIKLDNNTIIRNREVKKHKTTQTSDRRNTKINEKKYMLRRVNSIEPGKFNLLKSFKNNKNVNYSLNEKNVSFLKFNNIVSNNSCNDLTELVRQKSEYFQQKIVEFKKIKLKIIPNEKKKIIKNNKICIKNIGINKGNIELKIPISHNNSNKNIFRNPSIDKNLMFSSEISTINNEDNILRQSIPNSKKSDKKYLLKEGIKIINKMNIKDLLLLKQKIDERIEKNIKNYNKLN